MPPSTFRIMSIRQSVPRWISCGAVKSWRSEVLYDFIEATGLLDVQCKSRYKLVPALVDQIQNQQKEAPPSAGGITLSVGGEKK